MERDYSRSFKKFRHLIDVPAVEHRDERFVIDFPNPIKVVLQFRSSTRERSVNLREHAERKRCSVGIVRLPGTFRTILFL